MPEAPPGIDWASLIPLAADALDEADYLRCAELVRGSTIGVGRALDGNGADIGHVYVRFFGSAELVELLTLGDEDPESPDYVPSPGMVVFEALWHAVRPVYYLSDVQCRLREPEQEPQRKPEHVHNQAARNNPKVLWNQLRFRSVSETRIADALDRAGVMYLPNCIARLNRGESAGERANVEADFLVSAHGVWGILEVDGEPYHPAQNAAKDHERDRLFERMGGIETVQRYDSKLCFGEPDQVVRDFLRILSKHAKS